MSRLIAYSRVVLPTGQTLHREVVEFAHDGCPVKHYPLLCEQPFVEWRDATYVYGDKLTL